MMQPNFSFSGLDLSEAEYRLTQAAELASVRARSPDGAAPRPAKPQHERKVLGVLGVRNKTRVSEQLGDLLLPGVDDFAKAAFSVDPEIRYLYDATYKFVKGEQIGD